MHVSNINYTRISNFYCKDVEAVNTQTVDGLSAYLLMIGWLELHFISEYLFSQIFRIAMTVHSHKDPYCKEVESTYEPTKADIKHMFSL